MKIIWKEISSSVYQYVDRIYCYYYYAQYDNFVCYIMINNNTEFYYQENFVKIADYESQIIDGSFKAKAFEQINKNLDIAIESLKKIKELKEKFS